MFSLKTAARTLGVVAPVVAILGIAAAAPQPAFANPTNEYDKGGRPQPTYFPLQVLLRMNGAGIDDLYRDPSQIKVTGPLARAHIGTLLRALKYAPDQTKRLLQRLEKAKTDEERRRIVVKLRTVHERRMHELQSRIHQNGDELRRNGHLVNYWLHDAFGLESSDPKVNAHYRLQDQGTALRAYVNVLAVLDFELD